MKHNYENTKVGDIFVPEYDDIKDPRYHGKILEVNSWGVIMESPWLTALSPCSITWQELNDCNYRKPKKLNNR